MSAETPRASFWAPVVRAIADSGDPHVARAAWFAAPLFARALIVVAVRAGRAAWLWAALGAALCLAPFFDGMAFLWRYTALLAIAGAAAQAAAGPRAGAALRRPA
jgi:hypothetical protein